MLRYNQMMSDNDQKAPEFDRPLTDEELALAIKRHKKGLHLHEVEGNPLDAEDIAMFEMFERERWSHEKCLAYIKDDIKRRQETKK